MHGVFGLGRGVALADEVAVEIGDWQDWDRDIRGFDRTRWQRVPLIPAFLDLVAETAADRPLSLADVQSLPFMKYWSHLIIFRHEPDRKDFRVSFFGTSVVKSYGEDWTGRLLSQSGFTLGHERIYRINCEVMEKRTVVAESGNLNWQDRDHVKWHQVKLPLSRKGEISDVLTIICFE